MKTRHGALALLLVLAGCAHVPVREEFTELQTDVETRTGLTPTWAGVSSEEAAVAHAVAEMLTGELTVEEAVHITLLYNRNLQAMYAKFGIALADLIQAGLPANPVAEIIVRFKEDSPFDLRTWEVNVAQDFLDILLIPLRVKLARAEYERARLDVTREVVRHVTKTRVAFYHVQGAQQKLELMRMALLAAEAGFEMSMRLFEAGNFSEAELLAERARYEQAKLAVAEVEMMLVEKREELNKRMGLWGGATLWEAVLRLPPLPAEDLNTEDLEQRVVEASLDLSIAWYDVEATARRQGIKAVTTVIPELTIGAEFERETEIETEIGKDAMGEPELRRSEGPDIWWRGPSVSVPIPIFDQGQAVHTRAHMAVRREWERFTALAVNLRATARKARYRLDYARSRVRYYEYVLLPVQHRLRVQTQLRYNAMFIGIFHLLNAKRDEIDAGQRYIEALRDYWIARADIEQLLMGRMPDDGGAGQAGMNDARNNAGGGGQGGNG